MKKVYAILLYNHESRMTPIHNTISDEKPTENEIKLTALKYQSDFKDDNPIYNGWYPDVYAEVKELFKFEDK